MNYFIQVGKSFYEKQLTDYSYINNKKSLLRKIALTKNKFDNLENKLIQLMVLNNII